MKTAIDLDLEKLSAQAFDRAGWAEPTVRRYHGIVSRFKGEPIPSLSRLYQWMFVPYSLWPFNIQDVMESFLAILERGRQPGSKQRLILEMLPEPPDEAVCAAVAQHELNVQKGTYENLLKIQAKFQQNEILLQTDPELRRQWNQIKAEFDVSTFQDHKGVIRRSMNVERNLRPSFKVDLLRPEEAFQAAFDAFCQRWNLFGMQHDEPLLLKLSVNLTPHGTMIHIPAYWSFDPKRDLCWKEIAKLHQVRVPSRQGKAFAENQAQRVEDAGKLEVLDKEAKRLGLRGASKHEFLCKGLNWDPRTSPKRISRLRTMLKA